ncbi:hypothetical protein OSB04_004315 [Centaurea solstitialis]|uniref:Photosynthetic NDH subcomplex B 3 n=1 Tax=Centaurea solstitialis TaxID=347529 RepID=A0AA38TWS8_9ASTR|nr:hypothetical protein OSB04_004315 [Centaurea solstitialis]
MGMNAYGIASFSHSSCYNFNNTIFNIQKPSTKCLTSYSRLRIRATATTGQAAEAKPSQEPPCVNFAFVSSVLLPDGTPDVHFRNASGGQKLRDIMLDNNIELYGPYSRPLLNCAGGGTCATCMVEVISQSSIKIIKASFKVINCVDLGFNQLRVQSQVIEGKELLNPRTDKEKEKLKRNPKNWRLACQTTVGKPDSTGLVVIQQLPEWKGHEWTLGREPPPESS